MSDDMFRYQCCLLEYGIIQWNFFDAVTEGDGLKILCSWKFMSPYLFNDGTHRQLMDVTSVACHHAHNHSKVMGKLDRNMRSMVSTQLRLTKVVQCQKTFLGTNVVF